MHYGTHRGHMGDGISPIKSIQVWIVRRILPKIILVKKSFPKGCWLDWCQLFLNKFIEAKIKAHAKAPKYNYGYFLLEFVMFNWDTLQGHQLLSIEKWLVLVEYVPRRVYKEMDHTKFNVKAFMIWYQPWFPNKIINHYHKWLIFEATRNNNYISPIMEGEERIEIIHLPISLYKNQQKKKWIASQDSNSPPCGTSFFLKNNKHQEDEEFEKSPYYDTTPCLSWKHKSKNIWNIWR